MASPESPNNNLNNLTNFSAPLEDVEYLKEMRAECDQSAIDLTREISTMKDEKRRGELLLEIEHNARRKQAIDVVIGNTYQKHEVQNDILSNDESRMEH